VVENKYPALTDRCGNMDLVDGMYDRMDGIGFHEVVIETPSHCLRLEDMPVQDIAGLFRTFIMRALEMKKDPRIKYVMIFRNYGRNAGASLAHPHSQIIAMPIAPIRVEQEIAGAAAYGAKNGGCVFCDIMRRETANKKRVVGENRDFLAIAPYASRFSFETWILPKKHESHFERMPPEPAVELAAMVKLVLGKLRVSMEDLAYNLIIHTMPVQEPPCGHYHWHIEIMPKLGLAAGFEWGTGFYINAVPPETAAEMMNAGTRYRS
jgi:UDPglucose--hexose-1-phosphate uridylyltransferase